MMYQDYEGDDFLKINATQLDNFKRLSEFYGKFSTLPMEEEEAVIGLFRFYLGFDNFYEEWNQLELNKILAKEKAQAAVKELRGLFKIPKINIQTGNLHQQLKRMATNNLKCQ